MLHFPAHSQPKSARGGQGWAGKTPEQEGSGRTKGVGVQTSAEGIQSACFLLQMNKQHLRQIVGLRFSLNAYTAFSEVDMQASDR